MVDFTLTDEQKNLREMAHDFAVKEIRPVAWEYDRDGTWPQDIIEKAWELGLMNSHIPEEYGGAGAACCAGVRRLWLHQGVSRGEALPRCQDHAAVRGDLTDPAAGDRARNAAAAPRRGAAGGRGLTRGGRRLHAARPQRIK